MTGSDFDRTLGFTIATRNARGRVARLGSVLDDVIAAHAYPPPIERVLAEALVLTALLGALLKDAQGQLTLQAQTEGGVVDLLVCDYRSGQLRGYVKFDAERLAETPLQPSLFALFGKGYLAITFDQVTSNERYQGIVPLEGASLAEAAESYFAQSEQIPSLIRIASAHGPAGCVAGGLLLQHLPEGEEGRERLHTRLDHPEWEHVAILGSTITPEELLEADLPLETIVWRLFNEEEEVRVLGGAALVRGCRCDPVHIRDVLSRFPLEERTTMADARGMIGVDCAFCSRVFEVRADELDMQPRETNILS
ncbi:MAG: Hsp33 family molecular chaperone HslO [Sphingomonadaceae bacterium]